MYIAKSRYNINYRIDLNYCTDLFIRPAVYTNEYLLYTGKYFVVQ